MNSKSGFTLIELSIVLVIIGLIVGGVLVGQDLIRAAAIRAQISQIEKYNQAVNTFRGKYGYLPGDLNQATASQFGFTARGTDCSGNACPGEGNGDGLIEGVGAGGGVGNNLGYIIFGGETEQFWVDLSKAGLIDGGFTKNQISSGSPASVPAANVGDYMPAAKIGQGNYIYVWSGGSQELAAGAESPNDGINYFGLSAIIRMQIFGLPASTVTLTVAQAYRIDTKIDDGLPQSGRVTAIYDGWNAFWAAGGASDSSGALNTGDSGSFFGGGSFGGPVASSDDIGDGSVGGPPYATPNTCYDGSNGLPERYSMSQNNGQGQNCALSFQFQ